MVWKSRDQIEADREQYARALRESVGQTNLLVWTLDQTEAWYGQGSIYAHTPPADVRERPNVYWLNVGYAAQVAALGEALSFFTRARVVLTVSPVPLRRTFSGMPAIAAAGQAKGVLRAAAAAVVGRENVDYFPAYEYVNSLGFEARRGDGRHVRLRVVDMVVGAFLARYMEQ